MNDSKSVETDHKYWDARIYSLVTQENQILNQRLGWLLQIQGLLFAGLAFSWKEKSVALVICFAIVGISTALSLKNGIKLFSTAMRSLQEWSTELNNSWTDMLLAAKTRESTIFGVWNPSSNFYERMLKPWHALPNIFVLAWIAVVFVALDNFANFNVLDWVATQITSLYTSLKA